MKTSLRPVRPQDLERIHALHRRIEAHDRIPIATPREEFEEWLDEPHFDLARDARVHEVGGEILAWGRIWHQPSVLREERAFLFGAVEPLHRKSGIGSALFQWQIERATDVLSAAPANLPKFIRAAAYDFQHSAIRLFARHGMAPVRYNDELLRDLESIPTQPAVPGVDIVPWNAALSEPARLAHNDAFADHWGTTARDPASWST